MDNTTPKPKMRFEARGLWAIVVLYTIACAILYNVSMFINWFSS